MKKFILGLVVVVILVVGGVVFYGLSNLDALVKAAIEKYGSEATQEPGRSSAISHFVKLQISHHT